MKAIVLGSGKVVNSQTKVSKKVETKEEDNYVIVKDTIKKDKKSKQKGQGKGFTTFIFSIHS